MLNVLLPRGFVDGGAICIYIPGDSRWEPLPVSVCYYSDPTVRGYLIVESNSYHQITQNNEVCIEMDLLQVGSEPVGMRCPHCHEDVMTKAYYVNTTITHIIALVLGVLFWWLCCCIIPYVTKKWRNVEHYCPNCRRYLGIYSRNKIF